MLNAVSITVNCCYTLLNDAVISPQVRRAFMDLLGHNISELAPKGII